MFNLYTEQLEYIIESLKELNRTEYLHYVSPYCIPVYDKDEPDELLGFFVREVDTYSFVSFGDESAIKHIKEVLSKLVGELWFRHQEIMG